MSILSEAIRRVRSGDNVFTVFRDAAAKVEADAEALVGKLSPAGQAAVAAQVSVIKQGASAAIMLAAGSVAPYIDDAATAVDGVVAKLAANYLGPVIGPILSDAEADMLDQAAAQLQAQIVQSVLAYKAARATPSQSGTPALEPAN